MKSASSDKDPTCMRDRRSIKKFSLTQGRPIWFYRGIGWEDNTETNPKNQWQINVSANKPNFHPFPNPTGQAFTCGFLPTALQHQWWRRADGSEGCGNGAVAIDVNVTEGGFLLWMANKFPWEARSANSGVAAAVTYSSERSTNSWQAWYTHVMWIRSGGVICKFHVSNLEIKESKVLQ